MTTAELIAMSEYSSVHTIGNTGSGGWIAGLSRASYQGLFTPRLATEPSTAAAPTASAVPANVFFIICEMSPLDKRAFSAVERKQICIASVIWAAKNKTIVSDGLNGLRLDPATSCAVPGGSVEPPPGTRLWPDMQSQGRQRLAEGDRRTGFRRAGEQWAVGRAVLPGHAVRDDADSGHAQGSSLARS